MNAAVVCTESIARHYLAITNGDTPVRIVKKKPILPTHSPISRIEGKSSSCENTFQDNHLSLIYSFPVSPLSRHYNEFDFLSDCYC
jgi:hypothetical protein